MGTVNLTDRQMQIMREAYVNATYRGHYTYNHYVAGKSHIKSCRALIAKGYLKLNEVFPDGRAGYRVTEKLFATPTPPTSNADGLQKPTAN